jgi:hypothetical protein
MIEVEVGDTIVEFPDNTPRDVMQAALQKQFSKQPDSVGAQALDVAKSAGVGVGKGVIGIGGMMGDLSDLGAAGIEKATNFTTDMLGLPRNQTGDRSQSVLNNIPTSRSITKAVQDNVTGEFYKPQTRAGEYAQTAGEFVPGAMMGPGGAVRNALMFGVAPGVAGEAAGSLPGVKGTQLEPWVRGGTALATGGAGGMVTAQGNVAGTVSRAAGGADRAVLQQAEQLFAQAQAAGMPITRAEAVQAVTGGATQFGNLQRVVEGQGGMRDFFAGRAGQTDAAAGRTLDQITPAAPNPSAIGPAVGTAAEGAVNDVRGVINNASQPFYNQSANIRLTPQEMQQVRALPGYAEAARTVRDTPQLARYVQGLPEDSVGFLNEVKKQLDASGQAARGPMASNPNMQIPAGYGLDAEAVRNAALTASRRTPTNPYETALNIQSQARERFLQPLLDGPIGKIAAKDTTTKKAIDVLFPNNPLPNSQQEIGQAVAAVAQRNQYAARNLVRAHLEMTFNEATQNLASGVNSYGGAKFAAIVRGNPQQAANLEAAVRALPNGDHVWQGVDQFLTILEAQGQRQAIGSQTAFNQEALKDLRQGKLASEVGSAALTAGIKLPAKIADRVERWRMGQNIEELAYLFTDPTAGREFARLAQSNAGLNPAGSIIRLVGLAQRGANQSPPNKTN